MSRVIVTGASGFLGSKIMAHLVSQGAEVRGLAGRAEARAYFSEPQGTDPSAVVHCGFSVDFSPGRTPGTTGEESENLVTSRLLARYLKSRPEVRLVFMAAAGTLGVSRDPEIRDESKWGTCDPVYSGYLATRYIQDQIESERIFIDSCRKLSVLYLTTVYGEGMSERTLRSLRAPAGWLPVAPVPPGGSSFLGLGDLFSALDTVLTGRIEGRYVVSSGNFLFMDFYRALFRALRVENRKCALRLPSWSRSGVGFAASLLSRGGLERAVLESAFGFKYYNPGKLMRDSRWRPQAHLAGCLSEALSD